MKADPKEWLQWAYENNIHPWVIDYITQRSDHLFTEPPNTEEPYSTPRSWHCLSDALKEYGAGEKEVPDEVLRVITYGTISAKHAGMFLAYTKQLENKDLLSEIFKGAARWPAKPEERDVLYFLAQSFRAQLLNELPDKKEKQNKKAAYYAHRAKAMIKELSSINFEMAQMVISSDDEQELPNWFMAEVVRDLPRLANAG